MDNLTKKHRSWLMSQVKSENTKLEVTIRKIIFSYGFRYRLHDSSLPGKPDLVFKKHRKLIFINGCFWHRHKKCKYASMPKTNKHFWEEKFKNNVNRDRKNYKLLLKLGWKILIIWQCELKNIDKIKEKMLNFLTLGEVDK